MTKQMVKVGLANKGETAIELEEIKTWTPTDVVVSKVLVFFKVGEIDYSMKRADYAKYFPKKL